ncbi:hypothetical protein VE25_10430 [Devosia geojensis]|jgi:hypothetical protein|uniref:Helix-turn-helix domain-containing protein n=1 Tax=Devosia geojensis TaxID=443610 RepID=A0A0F5FSL5_9HYPH|nr:hypothetical protein [Devosia geojensis]KKB11869.1 hypothetical protein VE25_10430 [Devosia geojensis]
MQSISHYRARKGAIFSLDQQPQQQMERFLTTGQVATLACVSESYLEKGRIYGYGPPFIRLRPGSKSGAVRYRLSAVMRWLEERQCNPEEARHG